MKFFWWECFSSITYLAGKSGQFPPLKIRLVGSIIEKWNKEKPTSRLGESQTHMTGSVGEPFFTRCMRRIFWSPAATQFWRNSLTSTICRRHRPLTWAMRSKRPSWTLRCPPGFWIRTPCRKLEALWKITYCKHLSYKNHKTLTKLKLRHLWYLEIFSSVEMP